MPALGGREWRYVKECLDTGWVSSVGPFVERFEREMAGYLGAKHAVAAVNGTEALHVALLAAGVAPEHEVLVSTLTFIAPANAVRYVGAWPVFVDAEPVHWQMDADAVADLIASEYDTVGGELRSKSTGRRLRALLPVHILGHPVDMAPLLALAREYDLIVVEDATESLGAEYKGAKVGRIGDIACLSFNGNKLITTGGGGMIVTDNDAWAERVRYLTTQAKDDPIEYIHHEIGYNLRLTNIQAAMGVAQLERIEAHVAAKRRIAAAYARQLHGIPGLGLMPEADWAKSVFWMFTITVDEADFGLSSRALMRKLRALGIETRPLWQPMHRSPAHTRTHAENCPVADALYANALSLPCSVGMTTSQVERVAACVRSFAGQPG